MSFNLRDGMTYKVTRKIREEREGPRGKKRETDGRMHAQTVRVKASMIRNSLQIMCKWCHTAWLAGPQRWRPVHLLSEPIDLFFPGHR